MGQMLEYEYFITYFQPISLDSQQSLATHFHGLSTWTAIVWSGPKLGPNLIDLPTCKPRELLPMNLGYGVALPCLRISLFQDKVRQLAASQLLYQS